MRMFEEMGSEKTIGRVVEGFVGEALCIKILAMLSVKT